MIKYIYKGLAGLLVLCFTITTNTIDRFIIGIFSVILSMLFILGRKIVFSGQIADSYTINHFEKFTFFDVLLFVLIALVIYLVFTLSTILLSKHSSKIVHNKPIKLRYFILLYFLLLLAWMPYVLSYAPGSVLGDSLVSIKQILNENYPLNNHHPVAYTLYVGFFLKIGELFNDYNVGVLIYSIVQTSIMSCSIIFLLYYMYTNFVPRWFIAASFLFYGIMPFFPTYAIILWKDPIFSCALLWLMLFLHKIYKSDGKNMMRMKFCLLFSLDCMIVSFFRNNGIYIVFVTGVILIFLYRKTLGKQLKKFAICFILVIFSYFFVTSVIFRIADIQGEFVESVGVPLQQLAATIVYEGDLSSSEEKFLYTLLPQQDWKASYAPCKVDTLKWNSNFNASFLEQNKGKFFKIWFSVFIKNPKIYIKSYLLNTFGFWKWGVQNYYGYVDTYILDNDYGIENLDLWKMIFGTSIQDTLQKHRIYIGSGSMTWILLISLCLTFLQKNKSWITLLPVLLNFLTIMAATPVAFSLRYIYILPLSLPFIIALPFWGQSAFAVRAFLGQRHLS